MIEGKVKKKAYLNYLISVREDEKLARDLGIRIASKSIGEIRANYEKEHGSIYINI